MGDVMNPTPVSESEPEWVGRLREAGFNVRTGSGVLNREPDDFFSPPPGFRAGVRPLLRNAWKGIVRRVQRLMHAKGHATVP
jgi:hypothetical protein